MEDPNKILCKEQEVCGAYRSWSACDFCGGRGDESERKNIRCEYLGDDHRCGSCSYGRPCGEHKWRCSNIGIVAENGHSRKEVGIIIKN